MAARTLRRASLAASALLLAALSFGCFGQREQLRAVSSPAPGERLAIRVALYVPPSEAEKTTQRVDPKTGKPRSPIRHGEALAALALAHFSQVCEIVELVDAPQPPLDPERDAVLVELESLAFAYDESTGEASWTVGTRVSDALRLRSFSDFAGKGRPEDWSRPGLRVPKGNPAWSRLELAANAAMAQIAGQLWLELKREN